MTFHSPQLKEKPMHTLQEPIEIDVRALKERGLGHVVRVKMTGDACNQTHEWQLLGLNMGLNGNF